MWGWWGWCGTVDGPSYPDSEEYPSMTPVIVTMAVVLVVAALPLVYAAWPNRGEQVPGAPWLGDLMERATDAVPVLDETAPDPAFARAPDEALDGEPARR